MQFSFLGGWSQQTTAKPLEKKKKVITRQGPRLTLVELHRSDEHNQKLCQLWKQKVAIWYTGRKPFWGDNELKDVPVAGNEHTLHSPAVMALVSKTVTPDDKVKEHVAAKQHADT